jgi:hypothetical protein
VQPVARAGEPRLAADEALVLCRGVAPTLRYVQYRRVGTKSDVYIDMRGVLTPHVVKAGHYYLFSYATAFRNVFPPRFPEPTDPSASVDVRAGSVTYFGDLSAEPSRGSHQIKWKFAMALRPETLLDAEKSFPWLRKHPLYVSKEGGEVPVRWSTDPLPPPAVHGKEVVARR